MPETEARFSLYERIVESTPEGVWVIDAQSRTVFVNQSMADMLGYTRQEMLGKSMFDAMDEEGRRIATANVERRKQGIAEAHEFVFRRKDGSPLWARLVTNPLHGEAGAYLGALALATDLTPVRSHATEGERLWRILEESLNEIYIFRPGDLRFLYVNRGALANLGYTLEQMREMTPTDIKPDYDHASFSNLISPVVEGHKAKLVFQTTHRRRDGTRYPVEVHLQLVPGGEEPVFVAIINDISERLAAERALRASEARFRALIEESPDLLLLIDPENRFSFASPSMSATLGFTPAEVVGRHALELVHPDDVENATRALARAGAGALVEVETRLRHRDGTWRTLAARVRGHLGNPDLRAIVANARDVTNERKLEERLRQEERLGSIGRLAGGVAHDFNNILTAILGAAAFLDEDPGLSPTAREDVREILRSGARASELTGQLLAFASRRVVQPRNVDLDDLLRTNDRFLRRVLGEQIDLRMHVDQPLWPVLADPTQLEQVVLNLAVNARDAMPEGGHIVIEAHNVVIDEGFAGVHGGIRPGPCVVLAVSDTGEGIPPDVLPHIFEPFFTTKASGAGSGLGLATVYGIVRQCSGHITVYSEPGVGTTFKIYLPRSPSEAPLVEEPASSKSERGTERVLVVEDEENVRRMVVRALESAGYEVHGEPTGAAGLRFVRAQQGAVDLVVTDVVMPGMTGKQFATALAAEYPDVRVLYVSGYTENTIVHRGVLEEGVEFLAKPFSPSDLRRRVRDVIDRRK